MYLQFDLFKSAEVPERSKGVDLSSTATASWVRIPPSAYKTSYSKLKNFVLKNIRKSVIAPLAQLVEQRAYNAEVGGSSPPWSTSPLWSSG